LDSDCRTTTNEPGNCVPSIIGDTKYCTPLEGDNEWQEALKAVCLFIE